MDIALYNNKILMDELFNFGDLLKRWFSDT